jgi:hypothetical protein
MLDAPLPVTTFRPARASEKIPPLKLVSPFTSREAGSDRQHFHRDSGTITEVLIC